MFISVYRNKSYTIEAINIWPLSFNSTVSKFAFFFNSTLTSIWRFGAICKNHELGMRTVWCRCKGKRLEVLRCSYVLWINTEDIRKQQFYGLGGSNSCETDNFWNRQNWIWTLDNTLWGYPCLWRENIPTIHLQTLRHVGISPQFQLSPQGMIELVFIPTM